MALLAQVHRIQRACDVDNTASASVVEKLGMRREGVLRRWAAWPAGLFQQLPCPSSQ
jgi:RimJ/RimL family protein N-acetyltransferase